MEANSFGKVKMKAFSLFLCKYSSSLERNEQIILKLADGKGCFTPVIYLF
jgi:hypothetical protein